MTYGQGKSIETMRGNETIEEIASLGVRHIVQRLSLRAFDDVVECFCKEECGHEPDKKLCEEAQRVYDQYVSLLFQHYRQMN